MKVLLSPRVERAIEAAKDIRSGSFIFVGPPHIGKATAAMELARQLNCQGDSGLPCDNCKRLAAGAYPDFVILSAEPGKGILIEQVRALRTALALKPYENGRRVAFVDNAHLLTPPAQNALLKIIEEPPADTLFILSTNRLMDLLPTVRSRCITVFFSPVEESSIEKLLVTDYGVLPAEAALLAKASRGLPGTAIKSIPSDIDISAADAIKALPEAGLLDRLVSVKRYLDDDADPQLIVEVLNAETTDALKAGGDHRKRLLAIEKLASHLDAGVNPRVALERLMVEL